MIGRLIAAFPEAWRGVAELAAAPIAWLPRLQQILIGFFLDSASGWAVAAKCVLLLFPVLLGVAAAWCTGLAVYTLPFRSGRIHFISTLLMPTLSQVLADLAGSDQVPKATGALLWLFLLFLIMGSFACVQALVDAVKKREVKFIVQIVLVELFVMFFEVMFLYREMVDAITPWIVQQTGEKFHPGLVFTLGVATFGWVGIRGMTWFLFGQYGTPPLLAVISRQPMETPEGRPVKVTSEPAWWREPLADLKREIGWLHEKSDELLEYLGLPVLHLFAAALNFGMVLATARPVFNLPFKSLKEMMEAREALTATMHLQPRRQGNL